MNRVRYITQAGMIAAVYGAVTILVGQVIGMFSWGPIQFRVSEAVTVLAFFTPAAIPGLTLGSLIANGYNWAVTGSPVFILDVVFGSLGTLLGAVWMWKLRSRTALGLAGPVVTNAHIVAAYLPFLLKGLGVPLEAAYSLPVVGGFAGSWLTMYLFGVVTVGFGQAVVLFTLGWALLATLRRLGLADIITQRK